MIDISCGLCGFTDLLPSTPFPDSTGKPVDLYTCSRCGALSPAYKTTCTGDTLVNQVFYHENLWDDLSPSDADNSLIAMGSVVYGLSELIGSPKNGKVIFELGCGYGAMLRALNDFGYTAVGCEPSERLVGFARRYYGLGPEQLHHSTAEEFLHNKFNNNYHPDVIILWHVLEHVSDPITLLLEAKTILVEGGIIILQLPLLRQEYIFPEHYFFIGEESIKYLSDRLEMSIDIITYDLDNLYVTICMRNTIGTLTPTVFSLSNNLSFGTLCQSILLRDQAIAKLRQLSGERWLAIQSMEQMIRERDDTIVNQNRLLEER